MCALVRKTREFYVLKPSNISLSIDLTYCLPPNLSDNNVMQEDAVFVLRDFQHFRIQVDETNHWFVRPDPTRLLAFCRLENVLGKRHHLCAKMLQASAKQTAATYLKQINSGHISAMEVLQIAVVR